MQNSKIPVAILGATGMVGQRFVQMLEDHPWFEITSLAASEKSTGKTYQEICRWRMDSSMPSEVRDMIVKPCEPDTKAKIAFSGLDASAAGPIELEFAKAGIAVLSNARNHRMEPDVPLLIPEINPEHTVLIPQQRANRGFDKGFIVTNPNCSTIALALSLAPLNQRFGVEQVIVATLQAISGAGYPGLPAYDITNNVIPFISGEEEKIENETKKILGQIKENSIQQHPMQISASTNRVNVLDGHMGNVFIKLKNAAELTDVINAFQEYQSLPQELTLPSAPEWPVVYLAEMDRPQPRLDVLVESGMATVVGRVRQSSVFDFKYVFLGHNTIRGAAGAAILNAELLVKQGWVN